MNLMIRIASVVSLLVTCLASGACGGTLHDFTVGYIKAGLTEFREESTRFYGNDTHVVDEGTYVVTYGPDHVTERGKYLNVWTRVNGSWKIISNMWNVNAAATEAPAK